jgi:hypothetical protein
MGKSVQESDQDSEDDEEKVCDNDFRSEFKHLSKDKLIDLIEQADEDYKRLISKTFQLKDENQKLSEENEVLRLGISEVFKRTKSVDKITSSDDWVSKSVHDELTKNYNRLNEKLQNVENEHKDLTNLYLDEKTNFENKIVKLHARCDKLEHDNETLVKTNSEYLDNVTLLEDQLKEANRVASKWKGDPTVINFLNSHADNTLKKGLGYPKYKPPPRIVNAKNKKKPNPAERDFRKRPYVGLPEYLVCTFCGNNGHLKYDCKKKSNSHDKNVKVVKQMWIRKDRLHKDYVKGPNQNWVPKHKN